MPMLSPVLPPVPLLRGTEENVFARDTLVRRVPIIVEGVLEALAAEVHLPNLFLLIHFL
jgi:hypothetical protein